MGSRSRGAEHVKHWLGEMAILFTGLLLVGSACAQAPAPTVGVPTQQAITATLDVQPRTYVTQAMLTVTWNSTGATSCVGGGGWGGWAGQKATSGTQQIGGGLGSATFTLTCTGSTKPVAVSWRNPTRNVDGSSYTDPKHVLVYASSTTAGLPAAVGAAVNHPGTSHVFTDLPIGVNHFATRAVNLAGQESELSAYASADVQPEAPVSAPPVTVTGSEAPPAGVVSITTEGFAVKPNELVLDYVLDGIVGTVQMGAPCDQLRKMGDTDYYAINRAKYVTWTTNRRPKTVVVQCAAAQGQALESEAAPLEDGE